MMLDALLTTMFLIFLSEIADKTQLVIFALAVKFKNPWHVFAGAVTAHAFMDGIAILIGSYTAIILPYGLLSLLSGIVFILLGLWGFAKLYLLKKKQKKKSFSGLPAGAMLASFMLVTASEMGDKSQIASGILAINFRDPLFVFLGTVLALSVAIGMNIFIGKKLAEKLPVKMIKIITSLLFLVFGIATLLLR